MKLMVFLSLMLIGCSSAKEDFIIGNKVEYQTWSLYCTENPKDVDCKKEP